MIVLKKKKSHFIIKKKKFFQVSEINLQKKKISTILENCFSLTRKTALPKTKNLFFFFLLVRISSNLSETFSSKVLSYLEWVRLRRLATKRAAIGALLPMSAIAG